MEFSNAKVKLKVHYSLTVRAYLQATKVSTLKFLLQPSSHLLTPHLIATIDASLSLLREVVNSSSEAQLQATLHRI